MLSRVFRLAAPSDALPICKEGLMCVAVMCMTRTHVLTKWMPDMLAVLAFLSVQVITDCIAMLGLRHPE